MASSQMDFMNELVSTSERIYREIAVQEKRLQKSVLFLFVNFLVFFLVNFLVFFLSIPKWLSLSLLCSSGSATFFSHLSVKRKRKEFRALWEEFENEIKKCPKKSTSSGFW